MKRIILSLLILLIVFSTNGLAYLEGDGTDDSISCGSDSSIDDIFASGGTISMWFRIDTFSTSPTRRIFDKTCDPGVCLYIFISGAEDRFEFDKSFTGTNGAWVFNDIVNDTNIHHFALTYDQDSLLNDPIIYIDGSPTTGTEVLTPTLIADSDAASTLYFFNRADGARPFDGLKGSICAWSNILTEAQIDIISNAKVSGMERQVSPSTLIDCWLLNDQPEGTSGDGDTFVSLTGANNCTGSDGANNTGLTARAENTLTYP